MATDNGKVDEVLPQHILDEELERTRESFAKKPGKVIYCGSGWGALEEARLGRKLAEHLDFSAVDVLPELQRYSENDKYLTLMPHIHNTDGFFIAAFRKNGGAE